MRISFVSLCQDLGLVLEEAFGLNDAAFVVVVVVGHVESELKETKSHFQMGMACLDAETTMGSMAKQSRIDQRPWQTRH